MYDRRALTEFVGEERVARIEFQRSVSSKAGRIILRIALDAIALSGRRQALCRGGGETAAWALFEKDREPRHLDGAIEAVDGALEEFRSANKSRLIQMAGALREKILAAKGEL